MAGGIVGARFVDRVEELGRLEVALAQAELGHPSLVLLGGDAGVGKTRLLAEFGEAARARLLRGGCLPLGERGLPFAPVVEVLLRLAADGGMPDLPPVLARLVPGQPFERSSLPSGQTHLFQAFLDLMEGLATDRPVLMVLEDLHWADRSTRDLLTFIAHNLRDQRLLVVATYRSDDLHRLHSLRPLLAELHRIAGVDRIELPPFQPADVAEHLESVTGSRPSPELVSAVVERTDGNAFFIEELAAADVLDGRQLPLSLRDLLLTRTGDLSPEAQRLLRIASAAGRRVDDALLGAVAGMPKPMVHQLLREAVSLQLLVPDEHGYRFRHALLREALHSDLLPGERVDVHASYAEALTVAPHLGEANAAAASAELADHWWQARDLPKALSAWVQAGAAAEAMFAFAEAHHHFEQALDVWDRVPDPQDQVGASRVDVLRRAAEDAFLGGAAVRAAELAGRALELVDERADPRLAGILHGRLARFVWDTSEQAGAYDLHRRAVELVPSDPPSVERAQVLAGLGGQLMVLGRYREARDLCDEAVSIARTVGAPQPEYMALDTLGTVVCTLEDVDEGLRLLQEALRMAEAHGDALEQMRAHWNLFANTFTAGRWEDAMVRFRQVADALPRLGQGHLVGELQTTAADALLRLGRWDEADRLIEEARSRQRPGEEPLRLPDMDVARGAFDTARVYLEHRLAEQTFMTQELGGWAHVTLADIATWEGRHDDARAEVERALALTADQDEPLAIAYACAVGLRAEADRCDRARVLAGETNLDHARRFGSRLHAQIGQLLARPGPTDGWKREVGALALQCDAEAARLRGDRDAEAWSRAGDNWEQLSMPYAAAYCRWRQAEALLGSVGSRPMAQRALATAHDTASTLGALPLLDAILRLAGRARIDLGSERPVAKPDGQLTPRERDVLDLVAGGRSNRQIAEALYISEKTASVHVSNILRKLQVSSRGEAAAVAYQRGLVG